MAIKVDHKIIIMSSKKYNYFKRLFATIQKLISSVKPLKIKPIA